MAKDIGKDKRPEGSGSIIKRTSFVDARGRVVKTIEGEILQKWEGKDIERSKPKAISLILLDGATYKIMDIHDVSAHYNLTREIQVAIPTKEELGKTANVEL